MIRTDPTINFLNPNLGHQLKFFFRVNTSLKKEENVNFSGVISKINMKDKLNLINSSYIDQSNKSFTAHPKIEKTVQIIIGTPFLGTLASLVASIVYLVSRTINERDFYKEVDKMIPSDKKKAQAILEYVKQNFSRAPAAEQITEKHLREICSLILDKKFDEKSSLSNEETEKNYFIVSWNDRKYRSFRFKKRNDK